MKYRVSGNWIYAVLLLILIGIAVSENRPAAAGKGGEGILSIASGGSGGTYYYIAAGQAKILSEYLEGVEVTTQATSGSPVENMTLVSQSPSNLGLVTVDGLYYAAEGDSSRGFSQPLDGLRAVQAGHTAYLYGVCLKESGITDYSVMAGKRISVPPVGSTTYYMALAVAQAYGCNEENSEIIPMSAGEQADALRDGTIDAAFMAGGIPQATITDLDFSVDLVYLSIDSKTAKALAEEYPFWDLYTMPAGTYTKQKEPMNCLSVRTLLVCSSQMDEEMVYEITRILNSHVDELAAIHANGSEWNEQTTREYLDEGLIQFHPGAKRYYSEAGV